jgi:hypothetical protein
MKEMSDTQILGAALGVAIAVAEELMAEHAGSLDEEDVAAWSYVKCVSAAHAAGDMTPILEEIAREEKAGW